MQKNPQFSFQSKPQLSLNPRSQYIELGGASDKNYHIKSADSHLILSSSAGSIVALSSSLYASGSSHVMTGTLRVDPNLDLSNAGAVYHVRAVNSHLILSSSVGSTIAMSGGLRLQNEASGSIAAPAVGTMLWHTTTNQAADNLNIALALERHAPANYTSTQPTNTSSTLDPYSIQCHRFL